MNNDSKSSNRENVKYRNSVFVDLFYEDETADAIEEAVKACIKRNILRSYLQRKGSQVRNMLIAEYDYATDIEVQREEAMEEGIIKGKIEDIIDLLTELGPIPEELSTKINKEKNLDTLKKWFRLAAKADSIEEFISQMEK